MQAGRVGVMHLLIARGPQHVTEVAVEVLNVTLTFELELVLAKPQNAHDAIVEVFRSLQIGHCDVDVVDSDDFGHEIPRRIC
jgi:hypothetical protein